MNRSFALHFVLAGALFSSAGRAFGSPVPHQHQIPQAIIVNGQQAEGVTVTQNGLALTFYCPNPQPYSAVDQSSSGWACFDANTGRWSLNAMPPACPPVGISSEKTGQCDWHETISFQKFRCLIQSETFVPSSKQTR